jgi:hypothetical protein
VPSKHPPIVRRRSRGSLPRLHLSDRFKGLLASRPTNVSVPPATVPAPASSAARSFIARFAVLIVVRQVISQNPRGRDGKQRKLFRGGPTVRWRASKRKSQRHHQEDTKSREGDCDWIVGRKSKHAGATRGPTPLSMLAMEQKFRNPQAKGGLRWLCRSRENQPAARAFARNDRARQPERRVWR